MRVVGVGCAPGLLTEEAKRVIADADEVYGSRRALALAEDPEGGREIEDWSALDQLPDDAVLLSTGDPAFSGLGKHGGPDDVPGISCYQLGCIRLGLRMDETVPLTTHGRDPGDAADRISSLLDMGLNVFVLPGGLTAPEIEEVARERGAETVVCERLGYGDEAVVPPGEEHREPFSVVAGRGVESPG
ncbi:MAG: hypothetical protein MAG715_01302 [Methanonatronarchaeales archaeon]|nr:hypothetical protein [Methanonatronarchaeales archaeon]